MDYELSISKGFIRQVFRIVLITGIITGLTILGRVVSPMGENGKPALLSPRLAEITAYQRDARRWVAELQEIQAGLGVLLADPSGDLLAQDTQANLFYGRLLSLQAEVDGRRVPPTLESLHSAIQDTVTAMLNAASDVTAWISEPTKENSTSAGNALQAANDLLGRINQNPWIIQP